MASRYPVALDLSGRPCLVVGGGRVGARKVLGLQTVGAHVTVIAPDVDDAIERAGADRSLTWWDRRFATADLDAAPWAFVVAATSDPGLNREVAVLATAVGVWANDASSADGGPAALPAVHREWPITLTASTGGTHPGAARWLRDIMAEAIGPEHVTAVTLAGEVRAEHGQGRPDWRAAVESGMLELIREGHLTEAKERLQACLSSSLD